MTAKHDQEIHDAGIDDHDLGLQHDLKTLIGRRRALGWLGATALTGLVSACDSRPDMPPPEPDQTGFARDGGECVAHPMETQGPYPADGSNQAHGTLANVLDQSGVVRANMRTGFGGLAGEAEGAPLEMSLKLVNVNAACAPLAGHALYLWHCDADGRYSIYDLPETNYLRAVGVSDVAGVVRFRTIFPGCYDGRYPHMHFEVYPTLDKARDYRNRLLTSQLAMPKSACDAVYALPRYTDSAGTFRRSPLASDNVFGDNTAKQLAAQTPIVRGDPQSGYAATATIGLAV